MRFRYWLKLFALATVSLLFAFFILTAYISNLSVQAYLHPQRIAPSAQSLGAPYEEIELITKDGVKISAWYTPPQNGAVILLAHGLSSNRAATPYAMFVKHGYGVLAWDFRAHGKSGGDFSTLGYSEQMDVDAALDYALAQPDVKHIGAWGGSMGAATLIIAAANHPKIEALVSDSAYPTLEEAITISLPRYARVPMTFWWEASSGAKLDQIRPVDKIGEISPRAVFIIDGWYSGAEVMKSPTRLYEAAKEPKQVWTEKGVPHLGMSGYYPKLYEAKVFSFFDKYLLGK